MDHTKPIHSVYEDDPDLEDEIDHFVIALARNVDDLQDAESDRSYARLAGLADELACDAERLGFRPLAEVARHVARACADEKHEPIEEALIELTQVSMRVRRGHRGAA